MPTTREYRDAYAHLECPPVGCDIVETDYYLVILADARHFDYTDTKTLLKTVVKNPIDGSKAGNVGHAWLYLRGKQDGKTVVVEGGHSGEFGIIQPRYFDGVMNYVQYGYEDPTPEQKKHPRCEPNPIKYLWATQKDGVFQDGPGNHCPSFAAKVDLTEDQYQRIVEFMDPKNYNYADYSLTKGQCSFFVAQVAALADIPLEYQVTIPIDSCIEIAGQTMQLWKDPTYSSITIGVPDAIERSLMKLVREGRAEAATEWYLNKFPERRKSRVKAGLENVYLFPLRVGRYVMFQ